MQHRACLLIQFHAICCRAQGRLLSHFQFKLRTLPNFAPPGEIRGYKDRGGPAQLGIRDWAGLKGHIDDRNLACSLASEGRGESPRGRLGVTPAGTERQKVGFGRVRIGLIRAMEAMQLNAKKCHTKEGSMPVDIELVEVD